MHTNTAKKCFVSTIYIYLNATNFDHQLSPNFHKFITSLLFYEYVEMQQVRILVFDNYQMCQVPGSNRDKLNLRK